jgi:hypothetical protein
VNKLIEEALKLAEEALQRSKRNHYYCDDTWYSCPKAEDGCANDAEGDDCNCGADVLNAEIDKALAAVREALAEPVKQEPVAFISAGGFEELKLKGKTEVFAERDYECVGTFPLYAAPVDAKAICLAIHYPDCWDTAAYPTLDSALAEVAASGKPFRCTNDDCVDAKAIRARGEK